MSAGGGWALRCMEREELREEVWPPHGGWEDCGGCWVREEREETVGGAGVEVETLEREVRPLVDSPENG